MSNRSTSSQFFIIIREQLFPGGVAAKKKKASQAQLVQHSAPPPAPRNKGTFLDCGSAMLSRQFDRDRDRALQRAENDKVGAVVVWVSDIEKQSQLQDLAQSNPGFCYFVCGIHPDNIDRTNKKCHEGWMEKIESLARRPDCVALLTGAGWHMYRSLLPGLQCFGCSEGLWYSSPLF